MRELKGYVYQKHAKKVPKKKMTKHLGIFVWVGIALMCKKKYAHLVEGLSKQDETGFIHPTNEHRTALIMRWVA